MRIICFFVFSFGVQSASSQFSDSVPHFIQFKSTGIVNQTNTGSSYVLSNSLHFNTLKKNFSLNTAAGWVYGANQQSVSNNDLTTHADVNFTRPLKKISYWGLANFDKILSLRVNYRLQAGAGVSYDFIDSPYLRINVSNGILYEAADIKESNTENRSYSIPRNSFRLLYKWKLQNRFTLSGVHFYQPSILSIQDYIIQSSSNISMKIYQWLSLNVTLVYNRASNTNRENLLLTYGIGLEKYF